MRVYVTGAQSSGKTTLARWIEDEYQLKLITEVVRRLVAARETTLDKLRIDMDESNRLQDEIFKRQWADEMEAVRDHGGFVSDRSLDFMAYTSAWATNAAALADTVRYRDYVNGLKQTDAVVFFVRPHRELVKDDGMRSPTDLRWDEVVRIDAMIECLLETNGVPYIAVPMLSMRDRTRLVGVVLNMYKRTVENADKTPKTASA